jgi:site-specific DNA-methyltransferase (adenine-specific)
MTDPYYADERVTLYHGDCREATEWLAADVLVTDPPYGLGDKMRGGVSEWPRWKEGLNLQGGLSWDASTSDLVPTLPGRFSAAIIWGGNYYPLPPRRGWLVWDKVVRRFSSGHCELAWTTLNQPVRAFNFATGRLANVKQHPTEKPVMLMIWCLSFLDESSTVADPFAGSGSTLVAAKQQGRTAIGVEIEERYCEIAARRLAQGVLDLEAAP